MVHGESKTVTDLRVMQLRKVSPLMRERERERERQRDREKERKRERDVVTFLK